ncbi:MAG: hypothetical protein ACD_58C00296G0009 [uncultured bacterium]|nr:MAG: hypothetical protein ACD_58C00296G0009 [uncultured bacterium]
MIYIIITFSILLILIGLIGIIIPIIPGSLMVFLGLVLYGLYTSAISLTVLSILAVLIIGLMILNYFIGLWGIKKMGATKYGTWGGIIGIIIGLVFSPFGLISIFICPILGTIIGEIIGGKKLLTSAKISLGHLIGYFIALILEFTLASYMIYIFIFSLI